MIAITKSFDSGVESSGCRGHFNMHDCWALNDGGQPCPDSDEQKKLQ